jgi:hypothetical protein
MDNSVLLKHFSIFYIIYKVFYILAKNQINEVFDFIFIF